MCLFSIRSSKIQWMSTWSTILAHPCTIAFINAHTFQQILRCCAALVRLPPVCVIWYITSEKTSQYYLRLVSAHKHSKVICHRQSVWHSHLTDTWHIIRVIFCHGHFSAVAAADKVRLVLHCHWMLSFSHLLTANVSGLHSTPLCATAQLSTLKAATRYTLFDDFLWGCFQKCCSKCCCCCVAVAISD